MLNLRQEFSSQWHRFLHPGNPQDENVLEIEIDPGLFLFRDVGKTLNVVTLGVLARCSEATVYNFAVKPPSQDDEISIALNRSDDYGGLHFGAAAKPKIEIKPNDPQNKWRIKVSREDNDFSIDEVEDVLLILGYEWKKPEEDQPAISPRHVPKRKLR